MNNTLPMRDRILAAAEKRVRAVGFNAVSFRDLATDVGVKSSSVHYHFPQKEDLGEDLVKRYSDRFMALLDQIDIEDVGPHKALEAFVALYGDALVVGQCVCLCAILGSESNSLPPRVNAAIRAFFEANIAWLEQIQARLAASDTVMTPIEIVSALEGAMIVSTALDSRGPFEATAQRILRTARDSKKVKIADAKTISQMGLFENTER